jgi:hypothetical protein
MGGGRGIHNVDLLFDLKERSFNCYGGEGGICSKKEIL